MHPVSSDPWDVVPSAMDRQLDDRLMLGGGEGRRTGRIDWASTETLGAALVWMNWWIGRSREKEEGVHPLRKIVSKQAGELEASIT